MTTISRVDVVVQGHTAAGDYLSTQVHLDLGDDNVLRYHDGEEWQPLNIVVHRMPVAGYYSPGTAETLDRLRRELGISAAGEPVDLGDDPDGDTEGNL
jgi:hypothetical protein